MQTKKSDSGAQAIESNGAGKGEDYSLMWSKVECCSVW
jgi:hypothetical protein